jgi:hypothetical protein
MEVNKMMAWGQLSFIYKWSRELISRLGQRVVPSGGGYCAQRDSNFGWSFFVFINEYLIAP